jgi:hypothetical protein
MNKIKIEEWKKLDKQGYLYIIIFFRYYLAGFFLCILGYIIVLIILNIININSPLCENIYRFIIFSILAIIIPSVIQKKYIMERLKKRYIIFGSFVGGITFSSFYGLRMYGTTFNLPLQKEIFWTTLFVLLSFALGLIISQPKEK